MKVILQQRLVSTFAVLHANTIALRPVLFESSLLRALRCLACRFSLMRFVALILTIALLGGCSHREEMGLAPGNKPPPFQLKSLKGEIASLESFKGKTVLLNFWASWCAPCVEEMPALQNLYSKAEGLGLEVVAVAVSDAEDAVSKFREANNLTFPILLDPEGEVRDQYKVQGFPESFIIDKNGRLILFPDPEKGIPSVRIVGGRSWDSDQMLARLGGFSRSAP